MKNINNYLNVPDDEKKIIFDALIYFLYEYCVDDTLFNKVDNLIDKYFNEDDYLL